MALTKPTKGLSFPKKEYKRKINLESKFESTTESFTLEATPQYDSLHGAQLDHLPARVGDEKGQSITDPQVVSVLDNSYRTVRWYPNKTSVHPAVDEVFIDYETGTIQFNPADAGKQFTVTYFIRGDLIDHNGMNRIYKGGANVIVGDSPEDNFDDLISAINNSPAGSSFKLYKDITTTGLTLPNKKCSIDFNGFRIIKSGTATNSRAITLTADQDITNCTFQGWTASGDICVYSASAITSRITKNIAIGQNLTNVHLVSTTCIIADNLPTTQNYGQTITTYTNTYGDRLVKNFTCAGDITNRAAVFLAPDGKIRNTGSSLDESFVGFATSAGILGSSIDVVTQGICDGFSGLTPNKSYFLDENGALTTTPNLFEVGYALTATVLYVGSDLNPIKSVNVDLNQNFVGELNTTALTILPVGTITYDASYPNYTAQNKTSVSNALSGVQFNPVFKNISSPPVGTTLDATSTSISRLLPSTVPTQILLKIKAEVVANLSKTLIKITDIGNAFQATNNKVTKANFQTKDISAESKINGILRDTIQVQAEVNGFAKVSQATPLAIVKSQKLLDLKTNVNYLKLNDNFSVVHSYDASTKATYIINHPSDDISTWGVLNITSVGLHLNSTLALKDASLTTPAFYACLNLGGTDWGVVSVKLTSWGAGTLTVTKHCKDTTRWSAATYLDTITFITDSSDGIAKMFIQGNATSVYYNLLNAKLYSGATGFNISGIRNIYSNKVYYGSGDIFLEFDLTTHTETTILTTPTNYGAYTPSGDTYYYKSFNRVENNKLFIFVHGIGTDNLFLSYIDLTTRTYYYSNVLLEMYRGNTVVGVGSVNDVNVYNTNKWIIYKPYNSGTSTFYTYDCFIEVANPTNIVRIATVGGSKPYSLSGDLVYYKDTSSNNNLSIFDLKQKKFVLFYNYPLDVFSDNKLMKIITNGNDAYMTLFHKGATGVTEVPLVVKMDKAYNFYQTAILTNTAPNTSMQVKNIYFIRNKLLTVHADSSTLSQLILTNT